jgi:hypothetical protein
MKSNTHDDKIAEIARLQKLLQTKHRELLDIQDSNDEIINENKNKVRFS